MCARIIFFLFVCSGSSQSLKSSCSSNCSEQSVNIDEWSKKLSKMGTSIQYVKPKSDGGRASQQDQQRKPPSGLTIQKKSSGLTVVAKAGGRGGKASPKTNGRKTPSSPAQTKSQNGVDDEKKEDDVKVVNGVEETTKNASQSQPSNSSSQQTAPETKPVENGGSSSTSLLPSTPLSIASLGDGFNSDIVCEHGNLSTLEGRRKLVSAKVWRRLRKYFPNTKEFRRDAETCPICKAQQNEVRLRN